MPTLTYANAHQCVTFKGPESGELYIAKYINKHGSLGYYQAVGSTCAELGFPKQNYCTKFEGGSVCNYQLATFHHAAEVSTETVFAI